MRLLVATYLSPAPLKRKHTENIKFREIIAMDYRLCRVCLKADSSSEFTQIYADNDIVFKLNLVGGVTVSVREKFCRIISDSFAFRLLSFGSGMDRRLSAQYVLKSFINALCSARSVRVPMNTSNLW